MKRSALIIVSLLIVTELLFFVATGCGGGKDSGTGQSTPPPTLPSSELVQEKEPVQEPESVQEDEPAQKPESVQEEKPKDDAATSEPQQTFSFGMGEMNMFEVVDETFVVPTTDDLAEIKKFANMLTKSQPADFPDNNDWEHHFNLTRQYYKALYDTGVIIHDHPDSTEKDQKNALKMQGKGLLQIAGYDSETYLEKLQQLAVKLESEDDTKSIAVSCWATYHQIKVTQTMVSDDEAATRATLDETLAFVEANKNERAIESLVGFLPSFLAYNVKDDDEAETYATKLQNILNSSDRYKPFAQNIPEMMEMRKEQAEQDTAWQEGSARLEALPGNTMELECVLLNGDKLSLKNLEGKVVLIDFWASWCPPCREEVPGMLAAYEKYHDRGFEIIGYNVDDDEDTDFLTEYVEKEKLPWHIVSCLACTEAGLIDYTIYYGVELIPTMILVGKDGKVITIEAEGETLTEELEKIFEN